MKWILLFAFIVPGILVAQETEPAVAKFMGSYASHDRYEKIDAKVLKATKNDLERRNKKVYVETIYTGFSDTFPEYVQSSGFKSDRYFMIPLAGSNVPVMIKKNKDFEALFGTLKKGVPIRVYGTVEEFRRSAKHAAMPEYYFKMAHLQVLDVKPIKVNAVQPVRPRRKFRR